MPLKSIRQNCKNIPFSAKEGAEFSFSIPDDTGTSILGGTASMQKKNQIIQCISYHRSLSMFCACWIMFPAMQVSGTRVWHELIEFVSFYPWTAGNYWVHIQHCSYWCPGAKAPGHQYPQCWNITFIGTSILRGTTSMQKENQIIQCISYHRSLSMFPTMKVSSTQCVWDVTETLRFFFT